MANTCCYACSPCQDQNITTIITDKLAKVEDMQNVDEFIQDIERIINEIGEGREPSYLDRSQSVASFIESVGNPTQNCSKRLNWHVCKKCLLSALDTQTMKAVTEVLRLFKHMECAIITLSIIVYLLERGEQASSNKDQCIRLLRYITALAKHMQALNNHHCNHQGELEDILRFIVKATVICALKMATHSCCRFMCAPLDKVELMDLETELREARRDLEFNVLIALYSTFPRPSQPKHPDYAVGIDNARNQLIELFDWNDTTRRAVVIYGLGGIGKTTLATAIFSRLELSGHPYCRVCMDMDSDIWVLQEQILRDLFKKSLRLNNWTEGQEKLLEAFREASVPVFLFIDNVLRKSDLEMLLPVRDLSGLDKLSKILVTTRNLYEACIFQPHHGIEIFPYRVEPLLTPEAKELMCQHAKPRFDPDDNMHGLLQICGGIPRFLETIGKELCNRGGTESACREIVEHYKEWRQEGFGGEEDGSEHMAKGVVDFVYSQLRTPSQQAFLDIVFFFNDWKRNKVADIVGEMQLEHLEEAALITKSAEEKVKIHDVVRARGRKLSAYNRITDWKSWDRLVKNEQKLQQTEGIWLHDDDRDISVAAKHLDLMSSSLRVLSFGKRTRLNGRCEGPFEELRFLDISYEDMLSIQLRESRKLRLLIVHLTKGQKICEAEFLSNVPESSSLVIYLEVDASDSPALFRINGDFNEKITIIQHYIVELKKRLSDLNVTATHMKK